MMFPCLCSGVRAVGRPGLWSPPQPSPAAMAWDSRSRQRSISAGAGQTPPGVHGPRRNVKVIGRGAAEVFQGSNSGYTHNLWLSCDHRHAALPADALRFRCRISARMKTEKERPKRRLDIRKLPIMPQVSTPFGIFEIDPTDTSVSRALQRFGEYGRRELEALDMFSGRISAPWWCRSPAKLKPSSPGGKSLKF